MPIDGGMSTIEQAGPTSAAETTETAGAITAPDNKSRAKATEAGDFATHDNGVPRPPNEKYLADLQALLSAPPEPEGDAPETDDGLEPDAGLETPDEPGADDQGEGEEDSPRESGTKRMRIPKDPVWEMALTITRAMDREGIKLSPSEAEARAKAALGIADKPEEAKEEPKAIPGLPEGVTDTVSLRARIDTLKAEAKAALEEWEGETAEAKYAEIDQLYELLPKLEAVTAEREAAFWADFDASEIEAHRTYPELTKDGHPASLRAAEIIADWQRMGDQRLLQADSPKLIASLVAAELGLTPARRERAASAERKVAKSPAPAATKPEPGRGSAATSAPAPVPDIADQLAADPRLIRAILRGKAF